MRLHGDVGVQVVQCPVGLFATVPAALVHALNFFVSPARSLMLLRTGNWNKRIDSRQRMSTLGEVLVYILIMLVFFVKLGRGGQNKSAAKRRMYNLQLVVAVREKPLRAQGDLKSQGAHNASLVEGSGLPTQGATRNPWVFGADPDNAACRDVGYKASIAAGDLHKSGSSGRRLMDL